MIDKSVIKRLAIQCGAIPHAHEDGETYADEVFLETFATAIIENYKEGLVPVAYFIHELHEEDNEYYQTDPTYNAAAIPLYALKETK